jgi:hypothetical protein
MFGDKWPRFALALYVVGAVTLLASGQTRQECGKTTTIWTNPSASAKTVTARFEANCNEPEEAGEVSVYDASGAKVLAITITKPKRTAPPVPTTLRFPVPGNGRIDYVCTPAHDTPGDRCTSQILSATDTP